MKLPRSLSAGLLTLATVVSACESNVVDNSAIVDPGTDISYSVSVQPIFVRSCGGSGCHISETTNGVNLTTYNQVMSSRGIQYGKSIVIASDPLGSPIMDKISSQQPTFGSRMPFGRAPLSSIDIATIREWIDEGALNN
jgi:hypothetical protein